MRSTGKYKKQLGMVIKQVTIYNPVNDYYIQLSNAMANDMLQNKQNLLQTVFPYFIYTIQM